MGLMGLMIDSLICFNWGKKANNTLIKQRNQKNPPKLSQVWGKKIFQLHQQRGTNTPLMFSALTL